MSTFLVAFSLYAAVWCAGYLTARWQHRAPRRLYAYPPPTPRSVWRVEAVGRVLIISARPPSLFRPTGVVEYVRPNADAAASAFHDAAWRTSAITVTYDTFMQQAHPDKP